MTVKLACAPLSREGFKPFGDVVEMEHAQHYPINQGFAERFHDLAGIDVSPEGGETCVSLFEARARSLPMNLILMERHPLGSQLFYPLQDRPWIIVVCAEPRDPASYRAFRASGRQGINYARGCWHHPLIALDAGSRFLIVDRKGPGSNLEEVPLAGLGPIELPA